MRLETFLEHKPLYYSEIDYTRMPRIYKKIRVHFKLPKIIHVVGTNGKGTTGRFMASMLRASNFSVGHYSSPHVLKFNERIWINGVDAAESILEVAHRRLYNMFSASDRDALSYFEYTTFLAMLCFNDCDYVVLEAGLGGEHDATNVFPKVLSVFTPIAFDHQDFLGKEIVSIARTKCNSMTKKALIANQKYPEVLNECSRIAQEKGCEFYRIDEVLNEEEKLLVASHVQQNSLAAYLHDNLLLAVSALKLLGFAIRAEMIRSDRPFGRLYAYRQNITIDVGHNPLAAEAIKAAFAKTQVILVYNSYADKDYEGILKILKPIILHVEILKIEDKRIEEITILQSKLDELGVSHKMFESIDAAQNYLVFGSFKVVEAFVKGAYA